MSKRLTSQENSLTVKQLMKKDIKIEFHSAFTKPINYIVNDMKKAIEICEDGINRQYIVFVNGNRYKAMNTFGERVELD